MTATEAPTVKDVAVVILFYTLKPIALPFCVWRLGPGPPNLGAVQSGDGVLQMKRLHHDSNQRINDDYIVIRRVYFMEH